MDQVRNLLFLSRQLLVLLFQDWVQDKIHSKFVLQGMCWQKSFILKVVWQVTDSSSNTIKSLHADANTKDTPCTLVSSVKKRQKFDKIKLQSLNVCFIVLKSCWLPTCLHNTSLRCTRQQVFDLHSTMVTFQIILCKAEHKCTCR